jgi:molecular chaperone GrpE
MSSKPRAEPEEPTDTIEEASIESFPASDPPAWTPVEGERAEVPAPSAGDAEIAELRDRLLRALAEQENLRRRAAREREEAVKFAAAEVVKDLLPTVDHLHSAVESARHHERAPAEAWPQLFAGIVATERALMDALARHGIVPIAPARCEPFDPLHHHAVLEIADIDCPPGTVVEVLQPGFSYRERLLRPALVGVAKIPV